MMKLSKLALLGALFLGIAVSDVSAAVVHTTWNEVVYFSDSPSELRLQWPDPMDYNEIVISFEPVVGQLPAVAAFYPPYMAILAKSDAGGGAGGPLAVVGNDVLIDGNYGAPVEVGYFAGFSGSEWGNVTGPVSGYVGIQLMSWEEDIHYGWMYFTYDQSAGTLTLHNGAYESDPNVGIRTPAAIPEPGMGPVSYTHLTLPTICSV